MLEMDEFDTEEEYQDYIESTVDMQFDQWRDDEAIRFVEAIDRFIDDEVNRKTGYFRDDKEKVLKHMLSHCQYELNKLRGNKQ